MKPWAALVVLSVLAVSCSGDDGDGGSVTTPPPSTAPTTRLTHEGTFSLSAPTETDVFFGLTEITSAASGTWEATVDWTFPTNTLYMYVANGSCTPTQFASDACPATASCPCQFAIRSEVKDPKPRVLSIPGAAAGTRTLIIMNLGPQEESGTYAVRLTSTGPASAGVAPADQTNQGSIWSVTQKSSRMNSRQ